MSARPLYKTDDLARAKERIARLERCLADQKLKAQEWERAATRYHALLIQARVELIRERKATPTG